ncbi:FAD/NAD(P)-binding domain-containing protein [Daedaleopsis nitida]|nr:FAD/NAD(P)-binding domain-containing protein [Daedaleopsis nitida]
MPVVLRKATLSLNILVVGGGIAGLAVAYMLSKAGHCVKVLEKHPLDQPSGGQRVPPNLSKILRQWVGDHELSAIATRCVGTPFYRFDTGEYAGYLHWRPAVMAETGGEFLLVHHEDLVRLLYVLATGAGAKVDLNTEVTSIRQGTAESPRPVVTLASGEVLTGDLLVGADGCNSRVRTVVLGEDTQFMPGGLNVYTGVVKAEEVLQDADLKPLLMGEEWPIWMGEHTSFLGEYSRQSHRSREELYFSLFSWRDSLDWTPGDDESWEELRPSDDIVTSRQCPAIQRLIRSAPHVIRTQHMSRQNTDMDWIDSTERIVLLGDAAHPALPGGSHTASMAVEDAVVLGSLLSHLRTLDQLPTFLSAYEELRKKRCQAVALSDLRSAQMVTLPPGPEADARDANIRRELTDWDECALKEQFEEIADIFLYDAGDAAEEWWISWGRFHEAAREHPSVVEFSAESVSVSSS